MAVCYGSGAVLEIGRKMRAPHDERPGLRTYSAAWGGRRSIAVWLLALMLTSMCAAMAARQIDFLLPGAIVLTTLLAAAVPIAGKYLRAPGTNVAKSFKAYSGVWALVIYLTLGIIPMCWHWWFSPGGSAP